MKEIEVKILEVDPARVAARLLELGATKVAEGPMWVRFFDTRGDRLRRRSEILRLRQRGDRVELTYKRRLPDGEAQVSEEREVTVSDAEEAAAILRAVGFRESLRFRKHRASFRMGSLHAEIDRYLEVPAELGIAESIPPFLEIEGPDLASIGELADRLGFAPRDFRAWDSMQLFRHYARGEARAER
jgi:predicted adenylyl cyclase CyaB